MKCTEEQLRELTAQWREFVKLSDMSTAGHIRTDEAVAYLECIEELEQMLDGDFSPIEKIAD